MKDEVKVTISGTQGQQSPEEKIEVVSIGQMCKEDGATYITYDEVVGEEENGLVQVVKNTLKINEEQVEVIKKGPTESHMVFVPNQTTFTYYSTPLGELEVSVYTENIERVKRKNGFALKIQYGLEMNQTFISSCNVDIKVEH